MKRKPRGSASFKLERTTVAEVTVAGQKQRISWIRMQGVSISQLVTQFVMNEKGDLGQPRLLAMLDITDREEQIKAICRDYVARQATRSMEQVPLPKAHPEKDLRVDEEVEYNVRSGRPLTLFGQGR